MSWSPTYTPIPANPSPLDVLNSAAFDAAVRRSVQGMGKIDATFRAMPWSGIDLPMVDDLPPSPKDGAEVNLLTGETPQRKVYRRATDRWYSISAVPNVDTLPATPAEGDEVNVLVEAGVYTRVAYVNGAWMQVGPPPRVTALPTTIAADIPGMVVSYVADDTNGIEWMLRFDSTEATYKWHFVGGPDLFAFIATSQTTTSTSYTDLTTNGPDITLPLAGDYDISHGFRGGNNTGDQAIMSYALGGTAASDGWVAVRQSGGVNYVASVTGRYVHAGRSASELIRAKYRGASGGTATFIDRWLRIKPIRVV